MRYKNLGHSDLKISLICLGTMTWGRQNNEAEGHEQMDYALSRGINFWDTAELYAVPPRPETYGKTEEIIGNWFAKTGRRSDVILASKISGEGVPWIRSGDIIDRKNILIALEGSLKRLQTDYIDLYQLHWPNRGSNHFARHFGFAPHFDPAQVEENFLEVLNCLQEQIKAGKIRHIGLSNETSYGTVRWAELARKHNLPRMVSIQNEYSLTCRMFESDLQEVCMAEECGLLAYSPLAGGIISGKYLGGARPEGCRHSFDERPPHRMTAQSERAVARYKALAEEYNLDVCQMALAFVNSRSFVNSNIIGATSMEQLKTNIDSIDLVLSPEITTQIEAIHRDCPMPY